VVYPHFYCALRIGPLKKKVNLGTHSVRIQSTLRMRKIYLLFIACLCTFISRAQTITAATYPMTTSVGATLEDMTGATTAINSSVDDNVSGLLSFGDGFEFMFGATLYNSFSVSPDGWIRLGAAATNQFPYCGLLG
jgi:hypothetical protein